jgi:iron complex transport system ATP-binding protein
MNMEMKQATEQGIVVDSLTWCPGKDRKPILYNLNCLFEKGNIYGIIGPNGSGKTSLMKNILRFIEAEEGSIVMDEINLMNLKRKDLAKKLRWCHKIQCLKALFSLTIL